MATIIINAITHRTTYCCALTDADVQVYDNNIAGYWCGLRKDIKQAGFGFEVDQNGQGSSCYRVVDEIDHDDYEAAHQFMQSIVDFLETI